MKVNGTVIALIVAGLVLTFFLFRGCAPGNTHIDEHKAVDSTQTYWMKKHKADSLFADSMASVAASKDTIINKLRIRLSDAQSMVTVEQNKAQGLAEIIQTTIDTGAKFKACDSLAVIVQAQAFQVHSLNELTDSLISQYTAKLQVQQQTITRIEKSYNEQSKAMAETTQKYDGLYKDYNKAIRNNKTNKLLTRIMAGVILVLGGAIIIGK